MARAARERPRLTAIICAGAVGLVLLGTVLGTISSGRANEVPPATAAALSRAERRADREAEALRAARTEVADLRTELRRAGAGLARWKKRTQRTERTNRNLKRSLARARRR